MFVPDPNFFLPGSRIRIKDFSVLSSRKYEILSGSFIPDPEVKKASDPGSRGQKGTGYRILDPDPQHCQVAPD